MGLQILIAEVQHLRRAELSSIMREDSRVTRIYEAASTREMLGLMHANILDLVIINQGLIHDCMIMYADKAVFLAENFDAQMLKTAYKSGARGYLSINPSIDLLRKTLQADKDIFLIEPAFIPQVMGYVIDSKYSPIRDELLTPREKEIVNLLREGLNRHCIAQKLHISELTLKTHIQNIERKRKTGNVEVAVM